MQLSLGENIEPIYIRLDDKENGLPVNVQKQKKLLKKQAKQTPFCGKNQGS